MTYLNFALLLPKAPAKNDVSLLKHDKPMNYFGKQIWEWISLQERKLRDLETLSNVLVNNCDFFKNNSPCASHTVKHALKRHKEYRDILICHGNTIDTFLQQC